MSATCGLVSLEDLVAYWANDLAQGDVDRLDEHLVGCAVCSRASGGISAVAMGLREFIPAIVGHAKLESLRGAGHRVRENPIRPGERTVVMFAADTDLLVHKLTGLDLSGATSVGIVVSVEETGAVIFADPSVPFDRNSGEVLLVCQRHFAALPPNIVAVVHSHDAAGTERTARYAIPHIFEPRP